MHEIRLRGRWELVRRDVATEPSASERHAANAQSEYFSLPFDYRPSIVTDDRARSVMLRRAFHRPTGLSPTVRVTLAVEHGGMNAAIWLNDAQLGELHEGSPLARWDVTEAMDAVNRIVLVPAPTSVAGTRDMTLRSVVLEITDGEA